MLAFFISATRDRIPDQWIPVILISTQFLLLIFVWLNRKQPGMWVLGLGLLLNLVVISLNGGWMPIAPETLMKLNVPQETWEIGARHAFSKDMVLTKEMTRLWFLSDFLTLPKWIPYRVAFSIGECRCCGRRFYPADSEQLFRREKVSWSFNRRTDDD